MVSLRKLQRVQANVETDDRPARIRSEMLEMYVEQCLFCTKNLNGVSYFLGVKITGFF
jgi:hypothetical protein